MDFNVIISFAMCMVFIYILGKIFAFPLKKILKLILNSILGGLIIFFINVIGSEFGLFIGINLFTAVFVGILGIPGAVLLVLLKVFI